MSLLIKNFTPEAEAYLASCARIRDITMTTLMIKLIETIARDQLVLSILDDDSRRVAKVKGQHGFRERRGRKRSSP